MIATTMITQPKMVETLYQQLPASKREQIEKRNGKSRPTRLWSGPARARRSRPTLPGRRNPKEMNYT